MEQLANSGILYITFSSLIIGALTVLYRRILVPVHKNVQRILDLANYELRPNGGNSLADTVNRIEANQSENRYKQEEIAVALEKWKILVANNHEEIRGQWNSLEDRFREVKERQDFYGAVLEALLLQQSPERQEELRKLVEEVQASLRKSVQGTENIKEILGEIQ